MGSPNLHFYLPISISFYGYFDSSFSNLREPVLLQPVGSASVLEEQTLSKMQHRVIVSVKKYLHLTPTNGLIRTHPITSRIALASLPIAVEMWIYQGSSTFVGPSFNYI